LIKKLKGNSQDTISTKEILEMGRLARKSYERLGLPLTCTYKDLILNSIPRTLRIELRDRLQHKYQPSHWMACTWNKEDQENLNLYKLTDASVSQMLELSEIYEDINS
jgi:hypothetical protein